MYRISKRVFIYIYITIIIINNNNRFQSKEINYQLYSNSNNINPTNGTFWMYVGICIGLILFAGIASGLTIGLLSMDLMNLEILKNSGFFFLGKK